MSSNIPTVGKVVEAIQVASVTDEETEARPVFGLVAKPDFGGYSGVATVEVSKEQATKLAMVLPLEEHDILPTGEIYVSQVHYRRILNDVFKPGGWALVPRGPYSLEGNTVTREYALVGPGGRFISEAIGEADYQPTNERMSYASACEAARSNSLTRCCKDLGIASECWDKRFCEDFKRKHCVKVWRKEAKHGKGEYQWRRKDADPFWDEKGTGVPMPPGEDAPAPPKAEHKAMPTTKVGKEVPLPPLPDPFRQPSAWKRDPEEFTGEELWNEIKARVEGVKGFDDEGEATEVLIEITKGKDKNGKVTFGGWRNYSLIKVKDPDNPWQITKPWSALNAHPVYGWHAQESAGDIPDADDPFGNELTGGQDA